jgi:hypothetical protein
MSGVIKPFVNLDPIKPEVYAERKHVTGMMQLFELSIISTVPSGWWKNGFPGWIFLFPHPFRILTT